METPLQKYIRSHSTRETEALRWIVRQTNIRSHYPQMLSGAVQGRFLTIIAEIMHARDVLEIGTFTGYSSVCLAYGMEEGGRLDTLEKNDELEDIIREGWERAGVGDKTVLHIGDAKETLLSLSKEGRLYDLVYMDANKREYPEYYSLFFEMVKPGGLIIADDVLWDGKVLLDKIPTDSQTSGIASFNDIVASDPRVENVILPLRDGLSIIRKK